MPEPRWFTEDGVIWDAEGHRLGAFYTGDRPNVALATEATAAVNLLGPLLAYVKERAGCWNVHSKADVPCGRCERCEATALVAAADGEATRA